jgi:hypothetical protein
MAWHDARAEVGGALFDRESGIGAIPFNEDIEHFGATVLMRPSTFLLLACPLDATNSRTATDGFMASALRDRRALAPAILRVDDPAMDVPGVCGHEGRHRMRALGFLLGDAPVPVHLGRPSRRALSMDDAWLARVSASLLDETCGRSVEGPLFLAARVMGRTVDLHDGSVPVTSTPYLGFAGTRLQGDALRILAAADPGVSWGAATELFDEDPDRVLEGLAALGHRAGEPEVERAIASAARGRPRHGSLAAVLGLPAPAPGPRP